MGLYSAGRWASLPLALADTAHRHSAPAIYLRQGSSVCYHSFFRRSVATWHLQGINRVTLSCAHGLSGPHDSNAPDAAAGWQTCRLSGSACGEVRRRLCVSWRLQVLGLTTAVGVIRGTSSAEFAIALIFSMVVMYDASGVRLHAGKTASVLNMIITELPPDHPVSDTRPLRDTLGHTPLQARHPRPSFVAAPEQSGPSLAARGLLK